MRAIQPIDRHAIAYGLPGGSMARPVRLEAAADIAATTTFYVPKSFQWLG